MTTRESSSRRDRAIALLPLLGILLAGLALLVPPGGGGAALAAKTVRWERYDTTIDLRPDGSFTVTEEQVIRFSGGTFSEGFAVIPLGRVEEIENIQVFEDGERYIQRSSSGEPGTFTASTFGGNVEITWWFEAAADETRAFTLRYDVIGGLRVYPEAGREQLWWRPIDEDFFGDVDSATVTVNLPQGVPQDQLSLAYYTQGDFPVSYQVLSPTQVRFSASDISQGSALETRLEFPRMTTATEPSWQSSFDKQKEEEERLNDLKPVANALMLGVGLLLLVGGPIGVFMAWYSRGRDAPVALPIDLLKEPPDDLPPGAVGTLVDERANDHDVIATIVALGERGVIQIEEREREGFLGFGGGRDFIFRRHDGTSDDAQATGDQPTPDAPLLTFEQELLAAIFGSGKKDEVKLSAIRERFAQRQKRVKAAMYDELVKRGYFPRNPEAVRTTWSAIAIALLVAAGLGAFYVYGAVNDVAPLAIVPIVAAIVVGLILLAVARVMPRKTPAGAEAAAKWAAFRRYLAEIEKYENVAEAKEIFNRYLPYAVAFGLERSWVRKFASVDAPAPRWYGPYGDGRGGDWSRGPRRRGGGPVIITGGGRDGGPDLPNLPDFGDLQRGSDEVGRGLQSASDGLFDLFNEAAKVFTSYSSGGRGGRSGGFGGFSGGGRSFGGGGGGGSRGFR